MTFDLQLFAHKLSGLRTRLAIPAADLSDQTGIAVDRLAALEAGTAEPNGDEVLILADALRCDFRMLVSNVQKSTFDRTEKLFRKLGESLSREDRWAIQELLFLCETEYALETLLQRPLHSTFSARKHGKFYKRHGRDTAAALREHLGYGPRKITGNVFRDAERIGVRVFRRRLNTSQISGLYVLHPEAGACLLVNYLDDPYRQRFTAAHELAHAILDDDQDVVVSYSKWGKHDLSEVRANVFAAHYLLPSSVVRSLPDPERWSATDACDWAHRLRVNTKTLAIALKREQLVSPDAEKRIQSRKVRRGIKTDPELPSDLTSRQRERKRELLQLGLSSRYVSLAFEALQRGLVTEQRLSEVLLVEPSGVAPLADLYGVKLDHAH